MKAPAPRSAWTARSHELAPLIGRCALGDRGLIVFWSVGPDGRDDGADPRSDDIVWRLVLADATGSAPR
jgi:hypothetical protein